MTLNKYRPKTKQRGDIVIILLALSLSLIGMLMISSSSIVESYEKFGSNNVYLLRQTTFLIIGLAAMTITSILDYRIWKKMALIFFLISIFSMVLVHTPLGVTINGARRWIELGPILFQPAELLKLSFIIYISVWLEGKSKLLNSFKEGVIPYAILLGLVIIFIMIQKDLGTTFITTMIVALLIFTAGANIYYLGTGLIIGLLLFFSFIKLESYRWQRFISFLNPTLDLQGAGYQINQALIAIGSGGLFGLGFGQSRQKFLYLPQVHTDAIFAIMVEELGFIRVTIILMLFFYLSLRLFKIAKNTPDLFAKYFTIGVVVWIMSQMFVNILGIMGKIPLTGIPLPFISYGGSSLLFLLISIGIVYNISRGND